MKHKKRIIVIVTVLVVLVTGIITGVLYKKSIEKASEKAPVVLARWDDRDAEYTLCEIVGEVFYSNLACEDAVEFTTEMTLEEIIETNSEDYIGMREMNYFFEHREVAIFYSDNNYYYILEIEPGVFKVANLWADWYGGNTATADINFPFPDNELFVQGLTEAGREGGYDVIGDIFDLYDFEFFKEFYSRLSEDLYTIDEENQVITVKAYGNTNNISWESGMKYEIIIDCKNRTITGPSYDEGSGTFGSLTLYAVD